jgi:hypothetical protein
VPASQRASQLASESASRKPSPQLQSFQLWICQRTSSAEFHKNWIYCITIYQFVPSLLVISQQQLKDGVGGSDSPGEGLVQCVTLGPVLYFSLPFTGRHHQLNRNNKKDAANFFLSQCIVNITIVDNTILAMALALAKLRNFCINQGEPEIVDF